MSLRLSTGLAGTVNFVAAAATFVLTAAANPGPPCSEATPCGPQPAASLLVGAMVALMALGWIHLKLAAVAAFAVEVGTIWHDLARPQEAASGTVHLALIALALLAIWLATQVKPPAPRSRPGLVRFGVAAALVVSSFGFLLWGIYQQSTADARTEAAETVTVTVVSLSGSDGIVVNFPEGSSETVGVWDPADYTVGQQVRLKVGEGGWMHPVAEPYDATPWVALAGLVGTIGAGLLWRYSDQVKALA